MAERKPGESRRSKANNSGKRGISITSKITLWYMLFLLMISIALIAIMMHLHYERIRAAEESKLIKVVTSVKDTLDAAGTDSVHGKKVRFYYKDTYISMYDASGEFMLGQRPRGIEEFPEINTEIIQKVKDTNGGRWYIYDTTLNADEPAVYIRGMISNLEESGKREFSFSLFTILMPLTFLLAGMGGYLISRNSFGPVRNIIETTNEIREDGDLSKRVPLGSSHDEIYELSKSYNDMFESIEGMIKREKQFTSDVSHELRTPLAIIQAQSEYAMEDEGYAPEAAKVINRVSREMSRVISNLLMISRSDAGRLKAEYTDVDVGELLLGVVDIRDKMVENYEGNIELDIRGDIKIHSDQDMLTRIAINLISNAIKYCRHPGGRIKVSAYMDEEDDKIFVLRVSDNGEGISDEDRDHIWERFYRSDTARSSGESSGLGLPIVRAMVNTLGGEALLLPSEESELGGASFEIRLPAQGQTDAAAEKDGEEETGDNEYSRMREERMK